MTPPAHITQVCRFTRRGAELPHLWAHPEHYWLRGVRMSLRRCVDCSAFELVGHGGWRGPLEHILADAILIPSGPAYTSPEQPALPERSAA